MDIDTKKNYDITIHLSQEEIWSIMNENEQEIEPVFETVDMSRNTYMLYNNIIGAILRLEE